MTREIQNANYDFKTIGIDDFELKINFEVKSRILKVLISKAHKAIKMKTGIVAKEGELETILDKHVLPDSYNKLIHTLIKPILNEVYSDIGKDGIIVVRENVDKVMFYKENSCWFIEVFFKGTYHKN